MSDSVTTQSPNVKATKYLNALQAVLDAAARDDVWLEVFTAKEGGQFTTEHHTGYGDISIITDSTTSVLPEGYGAQMLVARAKKLTSLAAVFSPPEFEDDDQRDAIMLAPESTTPFVPELNRTHNARDVLSLEGRLGNVVLDKHILPEERLTLEVVAEDHPNRTSAPYVRYKISGLNFHNNNQSLPWDPVGVLEIIFQNAAPVDGVTNGVRIEDLLAICHHRLSCFQTTALADGHNVPAIAAINEAIGHLMSRTADRISREVKDTIKQ
jgi:hypothetical protein